MNYLMIGHAGFAAGTKKTVEFLIGEREDISTLDIAGEESEVFSQLDAFIAECDADALTVFTDLPQSAVHAHCRELQKEKAFRLIGGYNVSLLLETLLADDLSNEELSELVTEMRNQIVYVNDLFRNLQG